MPGVILTQKLQERIESLAECKDLLSEYLANVCEELMSNVGSTSDLDEVVSDALTNLADRISEIVQFPILIFDGRHSTPDDPCKGARDLASDLGSICDKFNLERFDMLRKSLEQIVAHYWGAISEWESASDSERVKMEVPKARLVSDNIGFFHISQELGRRLMCRNRYGYTRKEIKSGNKPVVAINGGYFKPDPQEGIDHIKPAMEFTMYSLYAWLGGPGLAAPTSLLKVDDVFVEKLNVEEAPQEARKQISDALMRGDDVERFLDDNPSISEQIEKGRKKISRAIQVGQAVTGTSLENVLRLMNEYRELENRIGAESLEKDLSELMSGSYRREFFSSYPSCKGAGDTEILFDVLRKLISPIRHGCDLSDFDFVNSPESKNKRNLQLIIDDIGAKGVLIGFAILMKWPQLAHGRTLIETVRIPKYMRLISDLFPNCSAKQVMDRLPNFFDLLDPYNYSAMVMASLLTNPTDGKADNYMVHFFRDPDGQINRWRITTIDSDQALEYPITMNRDGDHYCNIKCVLYFFFREMDRKIDARFRERFLSKSPEVFLLGWLNILYKQNLRYERLQNLDVITGEDLRDMSGNPALDIPIRLDPNIIPMMYEYLNNMHLIMSINPEATHQDLFETVSPILAHFYRSLGARQKDPNSAMSVLFQGITTIESIFENKLNDVCVVTTRGEQTLGEALADQTLRELDCEAMRTQSVEDAVSHFVMGISMSRFSIDDNELWNILIPIAKHFPFVNRLPIPNESLGAMLWEAIKRSEANAVSLALRAGADVNMVNHSGDTPLHFALKKPYPNTMVISSILKHEGIRKNVSDYSGNPPLFLVNYLNTKLVRILVENGVDPEIPHSNSDETLLTRAIRSDNPRAFITYVTMGAGRTVDPMSALNFIKKYKGHPQFSKQIPETLTKLSQKNSQVAWLAALEAMTVELAGSEVERAQKDPNRIVILGVRTDWRYLRPELVAKVFTGPDRTMRQSNAYGRRNVAFVEYDGQKSHFKEFPEMPGFEEAVRALMRSISENGGVAETELFRFNDKKGRGYPVLVSQHAEGDNLQDVFKNQEKTKRLDLLDHGSYTKLLFLTMLVNPEDGKPDNYILSPYINDKGIECYQIISIDNDHAFVQPVLKVKGHRVLQIKTIIYCMNQMLMPVDPKERDSFLALNAKDVIEKWLVDLCERQARYDVLFDKSDLRRLVKSDPPTIIKIPFSNGIVSEIYEKFLCMQEVMRINPEVTGIELLRKVIPLVGIPHEEMFKKADNPDGRFRQLFAQQYSTVVADRYGTLVTGKKMLESANIPEEAMISGKKDCSPSISLEEFKVAQQESNDLKSVKDQLLNGDSKLFKGLLMNRSRETILSDVVFSKLAAKIQRVIFDAMKKVSLTRLDLKDCVSIDSKMLERVFSNSPNLVELDISGCNQLGQKIMSNISKDCPVLEKLDISRIPQITSLSVKGSKCLVFSALRRLWVNDSENLESIIIDAPWLQSLEVKNSPKLSHLEIKGHSINNLSLQESTKVPDSHLERVLAQSPELLSNLHLKSNYMVPAGILLWLCSSYGEGLLTATNVRYASSDDKLSLGGTLFSDNEIEKIAEHSIGIKDVDISGCTTVSWRGVSTLLTKMLSMEHITVTKYVNVEPNQSMLRVQAGEYISSLAVGLSNECYSALKNKTVDRFNLSRPTTGSSMLGHTKWVLSLMIMPDGNPATGSHDKTIKVWDRVTGRCVSTLKGHSAAVGALVYLNGLLVSGSQDKTIKLWNTDFEKCCATLPALSPVNALEAISNGRCVAGLGSGEVKLYNIKTKEKLKTINVHRHAIFALKFISQLLLASGAGDRSVRITDIETSTTILTLNGHNGSIYSLAFLNGGLPILVSSSQDKSIKFWDLVTGKCMATFADNKRAIRSMCITSDGSLLSASEDGEIKILKFPKDSFDLRRLVGHESSISIVQGNSCIGFQVDGPDEGAKLLNVCKDFIFWYLGGLDLKVDEGSDRKVMFCTSSSEMLDTIGCLLTDLKKRIDFSCSSGMQNRWLHARHSGANIQGSVGRSTSFFAASKRGPQYLGRSRTRLSATFKQRGLEKRREFLSDSWNSPIKGSKVSSENPSDNSNHGGSIEMGMVQEQALQGNTLI